MIPLLNNQFNISRDFSLQLSKCLADSNLVVIGLTGIGPIRKISVYSLSMPSGTTVFILSVPMHCSTIRRFFHLYIHKHNSHIYRNVWSFCQNVLNFCKYTCFYLFLRNSGHFYFTLIPCFVKCPIIKP